MKAKILTIIASLFFIIPSVTLAQEEEVDDKVEDVEVVEKKKNDNDICFTLKSSKQKIADLKGKKEVKIKVKSEKSEDLTYTFTCDYNTITETKGNGTVTKYEVTEVEEADKTTYTFTAKSPSGVDFIFMLETNSETFSKIYSEGKKIKMEICILTDVIEH